LFVGVADGNSVIEGALDNEGESDNEGDSDGNAEADGLSEKVGDSEGNVVTDGFSDKVGKEKGFSERVVGPRVVVGKLDGEGLGPGESIGIALGSPMIGNFGGEVKGT
jgi:hypothetical protein